MTSGVVITGAGSLVFSHALEGDPPAPAEVTGFECPDGAPTAACELTDFDIAEYSETIQSYIDRTSALAVAGAKLALQSAGLLSPDARPFPLGLAYATTWGCLDSMKIFYEQTAARPKSAPPLPFSHSYANSPSSVVAIEHGLMGFAVTLSSGAGCGLAALGAAARAIRGGEAQAVLVGASEALSEPLYRHMLAAGQLSPSGKLTPDHGDGTIPGEGAAFVMLESTEAAKARGAAVLGTVAQCVSAGRPDIADSVAEILQACGHADVVYRSANGIAALDAAEQEGIKKTGQDSAKIRFIKQYTGEAWSVSPLAAVIAALQGGGTSLVLSVDPGGAAEAVAISN